MQWKKRVKARRQGGKDNENIIITVPKEACGKLGITPGTMLDVRVGTGMRDGSSQDMLKITVA